MLEDIKLLLGITDETSDALLELMLRDTIQAVLNYCHISALPMELEPVVRSVVVAHYNFLTGGDGNISSIKRGDTQITYGTAINITDFTDLQKASLNSFRKWRKR